MTNLRRGLQVSVTGAAHAEWAGPLVSDPQQRFRELLCHAPIGIACWEFEPHLDLTGAAVGQRILDAPGRLVECNEAMARLCGGLSIVDATDVGLKDLLPADDRRWALIRSWLEEHPPAGSRNFKFITAPPTERFLEVVTVPLRDAKRLARIWMLAIDATETKKLEDQLRQSQKMEAVGQLAGGIAHDVNNLLTAIFGWLELAASDLPPGHASRESLKMVDRAARQAVGLARSLLTFSRHSVIDKSRMSVNECVGEAMRLLGRLLPASIEQKAHCPSEDLWIDGDPSQIQQVLINLALNARDAMRRGGTIDLQLAAVGAEQVPPPAYKASLSAGAVALSVRDTGCGIAPEIRGRVFEPFFTTKERDRGTGLGLAIVHAIVTDHQGVVAVDSEVDRGSIFTVYLPRRPAPENRTPPDGTAGAAGASGARLLLVEDNQLVRAMLTTVLTDVGYHLTEAADGEIALDIFRNARERFDVAIVDVDLPKLDGIRLLQAMRATRPDLRALVITGHPLSDAAQQQLADMDCPVLMKPFHVPSIRDLVAKALSPETRGG